MTLKIHVKLLLNKTHSPFRLLGDEYDDLRKAVTDKNVHSLFRLIEQTDTTEDLRKALIDPK